MTSISAKQPSKTSNYLNEYFKQESVNSFKLAQIGECFMHYNSMKKLSCSGAANVRQNRPFDDEVNVIYRKITIFQPFQAFHGILTFDLRMSLVVYNRTFF